jgi:hypothetical protein
VTAGIVVMNAGAVALAADSVATIPYGPGIKHYQAATKVLGLHTEAPVAMLWYGSPDYIGMPWEVIAKEYRSTVRNRYGHLEDYAKSFFKYLDEEVPSWNPISSTDPPPAAALLRPLLAKIEEATRATPPEKITATIEQAVERWKQGLHPSVRVVGQAELNDCHDLWNWFDQSLALLGSLPNEARSILQDTAHYTCTRLFVREPGHSGIVFAGFGDEEQLPSIIHYLVGLPVGQHSRRRAAKRAAVSSRHPAVVIPFAQNDHIRMFMEGLHPNFQKWFASTLRELQEQYDLDQKVVERLTRRLADHINNHGRPVVDAVRFLPKGELAEFARTLIAFTAFRLRMSLADESVGEPIDVAVISRGEGLVWVHRSHYFPPELNPGFFRRFR